MKRPEVYIDGIKYIPATSIIREADKVENALIELFMGENSLSEEELDKLANTLRIVIHEPDEFDGYEDNPITIRQFIESLIV